MSLISEVVGDVMRICKAPLGVSGLLASSSAMNRALVLPRESLEEETAGKETGTASPGAGEPAVSSVAGPQESEAPGVGRLCPSPEFSPPQ